MHERVVEIAGDRRHLSLKRGFVLIRSEGKELGRVPLDDVATVLVTGRGITYSNDLLVEFAERRISFVLCDRNGVPAGWLWPAQGHHAQAGRMRCQAGSSKPLRKQVWKRLIQAKIRLQAQHLQLLEKPSAHLEKLSRSVRSGDPLNVEAQAARAYWQQVFGSEFRRDRQGGGINAILNFGYAVLRGAVARSVAKAGLHPSLGIHHRQERNSFCLVDDLVEPFRAVVDREVYQLVSREWRALDLAAKVRLGAIPVTDLQTNAGLSPLARCSDRLAYSLCESVRSGDVRLDLDFRLVRQSGGERREGPGNC